MKTCKDCKETKNRFDFYGVQNECKECTKRRVRKNAAKIGNKYDITEHGVIRIIYKTQKRNNRLRGHGAMPYTKQELSEWLYDNGFKALYNKWIKSDRDKRVKPSVDRLDDHKGYSFDNIRLVTWGENKNHQASDIRSGKGTSGTRCKKVFKYDSEMKLVSTFVSYWSAARSIGYSIEYQLKNKIKCRSGFFWSYEEISDD